MKPITRDLDLHESPCLSVQSKLFEFTSVVVDYLWRIILWKPWRDNVKDHLWTLMSEKPYAIFWGQAQVMIIRPGVSELWEGKTLVHISFATFHLPHCSASNTERVLWAVESLENVARKFLHHLFCSNRFHFWLAPIQTLALCVQLWQWGNQPSLGWEH